jgi:hypothetical protein
MWSLFKRRPSVSVRCRCHAVVHSADGALYRPICERHYQERVDKSGAYVIVGGAGEDLEFVVDGKRHRVGAPAVHHSDGTELWYLHGKLHRVGAPAALWFTGTQEWFHHGVRHREDGPALVRRNGSRQWFLHGMEVSEEHMPYVQAAQLQAVLGGVGPYPMGHASGRLRTL